MFILDLDIIYLALKKYKNVETIFQILNLSGNFHTTRIWKKKEPGMRSPFPCGLTDYFTGIKSCH